MGLRLLLTPPAIAWEVLGWTDAACLETAPPSTHPPGLGMPGCSPTSSLDSQERHQARLGKRDCVSVNAALCSNGMTNGEQHPARENGGRKSSTQAGKGVHRAVF